MPKNQKRQFIWTDVTNTNGVYAVFRKTSKAKRASFVCIHDTHDEAEDEAVRLLTESVSVRPNHNCTFFVIQIVGHVSFIGGKFVGDSLEQK